MIPKQAYVVNKNDEDGNDKELEESTVEGSGANVDLYCWCGP